MTVGEMPSHGHNISISSASLDGSFNVQSDIGVLTNTTGSSSGIISQGTYRSNRLEGHGGTGSYDININATHNHNASASNAGGSEKHNAYVLRYLHHACVALTPRQQ